MTLGEIRQDLLARLTKHDLKVRRNECDGKSWCAIEAFLCQGPEIALTIKFNFEMIQGRIYFNNSLLIRWSEAERVVAESLPPLPQDLPKALEKKIRETRERLFAIASLSVARDSNVYFSYASPFSLDLHADAELSEFFEGVLEVTEKQIVPRFSRYCDMNELANAVFDTATSKLETLPFNSLVILALAGRPQELQRFYEDCRRRDVLSDEHLRSIELLESRIHRTKPH